MAGTVSEVYTRLRTNFPYKLALQLNNETDYTEVVGSTRGVSLPTKQMQGLIKVRDDKSGQDKTYNVVFAHLAEDGKSDFEFAKTLAQARQTDARAKQIPTLPEHVSVELITSEVPPTLSAVPIGVDASELEPCVLDFENELVARVVVKDVEESESFWNALIRVSEMIPNVKVHVLGAEVQKSDFVLHEALQNMQNTDAKTIVFVLGANNFFHSNDDGKECVNILNNPNFKLTKKGNLRFVLVDTMNGLKDVCTYQAFATSIDKSNCLWLCAGFSSNFGFVETGSAMLNRLPKLQANQGYFVHDTLVHVTQLLEEGK